MDSSVTAAFSMSPQKVDLSGTKLSDFQLMRCLGQGGMGQVYLAEQVSLKRKVAVKVMRADVAANETAVKRFRAEAEAVAKLTHANIVQIYAIGSESGIHYLALEFVDGTSLAAYLAKKGPPPLPIAISILRQTAAALQHASDHNIVHRDIKPENILITRMAEVKVTDFGLARCVSDEQQAANLTQSGVILGTPMYMSPEQVQGKKVDSRTDIYSLGVTAYHLLTGKPPYRGDSAFDLALQHVQGQAKPLQEVRPDLPSELCDVVAKMMAKDPDKRFQTGQALVRVLAGMRDTGVQAGGGRKTQELLEVAEEGSPTQIVAEEEKTTPVDSKGRRKTKFKQKRALPGWAYIAAAGLAVVLGCVVAALVANKMHSTKQQVVEGPGPADPPPKPNPPPPPNPADVEEEQRLRQKLEKKVNLFNPQEARQAIIARVELAAFLLKHDRLDDAETFFKELGSTGNPPPLQLLNRVGNGIVLGLRGKAKESNASFLEADRMIQRNLLGKQQMLGTFYNPILKPWVLKALDKNAMSEPLPRELLDIRKTLNDLPEK